MNSISYLEYIINYYSYLGIGITSYIIALLFLNSSDKSIRYIGILFKNITSILFISFIAYYIGNRPFFIGMDTSTYQEIYYEFQNMQIFHQQRDLFFDLLMFYFSRYFSFKSVLFLCSFLYVWGGYLAIRKIFKNNYIIPLLFFLTTPFFLQFGINVMRSGVAASLLMLSYAYFINNKFKKSYFFAIVSVGFHISMLIPIIFFLITKYFKNTKIIFIIWLIIVGISLFNINMLSIVVGMIGKFSERLNDFLSHEPDPNYWKNFIIFGMPPIILSVWQVIYIKYKNITYTRLLNTYMLVNTIYVLFNNVPYTIRFGYLSEFMLPILVCYPFYIYPKLRIKYKNTIFLIVILSLFFIKIFQIYILSLA